MRTALSALSALPALFAICGLAVASASAQAQPAGVPGCTACHGPAGNSLVPSIPSIAGQPKIFLENQLVLIREGLRDVPAMKAVMGGLVDEEIIALARYFAAQAALTPLGAVQDAKVRAGAKISRLALCGTCHLPDYSGQAQVPRLAGQHEEYLVVTMKMYRDNPQPGRDTAMSAVLRGLQDADLANLAHHFAHFGSQARLK